jgi:hypothetical protein
MKADAREWDEQQLRMCLYPHDVEKVLKIRPCSTKGMISWPGTTRDPEFLR